MSEKPSAQEEVLDSFPFLDVDTRWKGAVEVVRREVTFADGNTRIYVDLRLRIGNRWLSLPVKGTEDVIAALEAGRDAAAVHLETLPKRDASPQRRRVFEANERNGRRGGRAMEIVK